MIIVSITGPSMAAALGQIEGSARYADMFEIRLDLISRQDFVRLVSATRRPVIATCRPEWEGGRFRGPESKRIEILMKALAGRAAYVDIELNAGPATVGQFVRQGSGGKVIVSLHLISRPPSDVAGLYRKLRSTGAGVLKLAYSARDASDMRYAREFLESAAADRQKAIAIAMGEFGEASRVLYRKLGGWATYAAPESGIVAAPGQIRAHVLKEVYRADKLSGSTRVFGVIGNPLGQSKGIFIHNIMFRRASVDAVYCRFLTRDLGKFMRYVAPLLSGCSVTIPFKEKILKYLDRIEPSAKRIGAVNTVLWRRRTLFGTNTDATGALDAIERAVRVRGKTVLILGAGGAARAIAHEALKRGSSVLLANRTDSRATRLVGELEAGAKGRSVRQVGMSELATQRFDILVNATSVGMVPRMNVSPVPRSILRNKIVFDAVYNPPVTKLLRDAKQAGARTISGAEMYVNQAAQQFELYTGVVPDKRVMQRILEKQLKSN